MSDTTHKYSSLSAGKSKGQFPQIWQAAPPFYPQNYNPEFPPQSWTSCVLGYNNKADKLNSCIWHNAKLKARYQLLAVSINLDVEQSPESHRALWSKICRRLREAGLVAFWIIEPSTRHMSRVHYHLIVCQPQNIDEVRRIVWAAIAGLPCHAHVAKLRSTLLDYVNYILKRGRQHASKRYLFLPSIGFRKHGSIGQFWVKPVREIEIAQSEYAKRLDELTTPEIQLTARRLYKHLFRDLDKSQSGILTLAEIEKSLAKSGLV